MDFRFKLITLAICLLAVIIILFNHSCSRDPSDITSLDTICFKSQILPLIQLSCGISGCHSSGSEEFDPTDYNTIVQYVKAGDPRNSELYKVITNINGENMMPPTRPLTQEQRSVIQLWISQGAQNIPCDTVVTQDTTLIPIADTVCFNTQVLPILYTSCNLNGCHNSGTSSGNFTATNYENVKPLVLPGNPHNSMLYQVISTVNGIIRMPPGNPLSNEERSIIYAWIAQGANNKICVDTSNNFPDTTVIPPIDYGDSVCFKQSILPIFISSCASANGCHNATSHAEGYILTDYTGITKKSGSIVPFNPDNSKIYKVITDDDPEDRMPPTGPLTSAQIDLIRKWISEGALNSDCPNGACDTSGTILFAKQVAPIFVYNCQACHNSNFANANIKLDNYDNIKASVEKARNNISVVLGAISRDNNFIAMPQTYSLDKCSIRIIEKWVEQGKQKN